MLLLVAKCYERDILFPLPEDFKEVTVGSLPENTISLPYKGISRRHFSIIRHDSEITVQDLGSTNGIWLNGKQIHEASVQPGDVIEAGVVRIVIQVANAEMQPAGATAKSEAPSAGKSTDKIEHAPAYDPAQVFSFPGLIYPEGSIQGRSHRIVEIYRTIDSIAESDASVLLEGETGTGKEMFARMLHFSSSRSGGPLIVVNCAAIPSDLLEAELFGIEDKVATNVARRVGKMSLAHGGTLFLDELGAFPVALQAKILRAVEEKTVYAIGDHRPQQLDFRVISATNEEPQRLIKSGRLREDLYHRLATVEIVIPPLRERKEDIPCLIAGLLDQISKKENKPISGITKRAVAVLTRYSYPGNVRELVNILRAMVALACPCELLDIHLVPEKLLRSGSFRDSSGSLDLRENVNEVTRRLVLQALELHQGSVSKAARELNITTFGLRKIMKRLDIVYRNSSTSL